MRAGAPDYLDVRPDALEMRNAPDMICVGVGQRYESDLLGLMPSARICSRIIGNVGPVPLDEHADLSHRQECRESRSPQLEQI